MNGLVVRQLPLLLASMVTGALMIYWLGFWAGIIINAICWGMAIVLVKTFVVKRRRGVDNFRDEKFLLNFLLALIGRK